MNFASIQFVIFLCIILGLLSLLKNNSIKKFVLLIASYFFYACWDYRFLLLILFSTCVDYIFGKKLFISKKQKQKNFYLLISLFLNLGILGFFKYYNFFIETAQLLLEKVGFNITTLNIILPVGISFYTFQTLSYSIDIYRKKIKPANNLLDFSLFVAFFPQLVAGPIVRAIDFFPQLEKKINIKKKNISIGFQIFLFGLVKKVVIADTLGRFVDEIFLAPHLYDSITIWLAVVSYAIQIFCDFSGYSDMAIGIAKMIGFTLPQNFNMPYLSKNLTEFWRRWHISLSGWLKDYLYISLGGNKKGYFRQYLNILITMILGGLWHGASWNFVFWGMIHGFGLIIHKVYKRIFPGQCTFYIYSIFSWVITFLSICVSWVFFRSQEFHDSFVMLQKMFIFDKGITWLYTSALIIIPVVILFHIIGQKRHVKYFIFDLSSFKGTFILLFVLFFIFFFSSISSDPFIYFQF